MCLPIAINLSDHRVFQQLPLRVGLRSQCHRHYCRGQYNAVTALTTRTQPCKILTEGIIACCVVFRYTFIPSATVFLTAPYPLTAPPIECSNVSFSLGPNTQTFLTCLLPILPSSWYGMGLGVLVNNSIPLLGVLGPSSNTPYALYYAYPSSSSSSAAAPPVAALVA